MVCASSLRDINDGTEVIACSHRSCRVDNVKGDSPRRQRHLPHHRYYVGGSIYHQTLYTINRTVHSMQGTVATLLTRSHMYVTARAFLSLYSSISYCKHAAVSSLPLPVSRLLSQNIAKLGHALLATSPLHSNQSSLTTSPP